MSVLEAIRRANQPGAPEDSIRLRVACTGAVIVAILACASQNEISRTSAYAAVALVGAGMIFSYRTRTRPPMWVKGLVAAAALLVLLWFFHQVSGRVVSDITSVENPLTVMFVWIQVVHSFHVPARRDLIFSLGGSAGLMAVSAAQAIDLHYGWYVLAWAGFSLWGLVELWSSASHGGRVSTVGLGSTVAALSVAAVAIFLVLPAPNVAVRINFLSQQGSGGSIAVPGALAGDGGQASELSRPGSPAGPTRVGGYLGFANSLDTALRGSLGRTVVMRVRAERPSYWIGETFDRWDGQSWTTNGPASRRIDDGSPFFLSVPAGNNVDGEGDLQTFYITTSGPDLVFHAESAHEVWFPAGSLFYSDDGTIVSPIGLGRGAIYTVESEVSSPSPAQLRQESTGPPLSAADLRRYTQLPHPYPQAQALARAVTASATTTYDRVQALIAWMGANTHYSTDIPPLPAGADTVNEFLFGNRVGFCEQISTSLAVMLRSLGIPAREAVGYVPGPYNPITDLYEVRAEDAHAWVQVWLPGHGWQSFDPTAAVPLANPAPGATALKSVGRALSHIPAVPVGAVTAGVALVVAVVRWRRSRPATWADNLARRIERAGRRAGRARGSAETITEYAAALDGLSEKGMNTWGRLAVAVQAAGYGGKLPSVETQRQMLASVRRIRIDRRHARSWPFRLRPGHRSRGPCLRAGASRNDLKQ
jgi:transglutaminase-like putative cysteine protease